MPNSTAVAIDANWFEEKSRELCKRYQYYRIGGYDPETDLAWASLTPLGDSFHVHIEDFHPAYCQLFPQVTRFQEGLACVKNEQELWTHHIKPSGFPAYRQRYLSVGMFFGGYADARDSRGQFHIKPNGQPAYEERFERVGQFCYGLAQAVQDGKCFHITSCGKQAYSLRGLRNGPFQEINGQILAWTEIRKLIEGFKRIVRVWINTAGEIVIDNFGGEIIE